MQNTTNRLLDAVKDRLDITSDYALAKHWNITPQRIAQYRAGRSEFSDERALDVACILGVAPEELIMQLNAERAAKAGKLDVSAIYTRALDRLKAAPPALFCVGFLAGLLALPLGADLFKNESISSAGLVSFYLTNNINYAQFTILSYVILWGFLSTCQPILPALFCSGFHYTPARCFTGKQNEKTEQSGEFASYPPMPVGAHQPAPPLTVPPCHA